jgi:hypothetical protein
MAEALRDEAWYKLAGEELPITCALWLKNSQLSDGIRQTSASAKIIEPVISRMSAKKVRHYV